jgi:hypothetical protein
LVLVRNEALNCYSKLNSPIDWAEALRPDSASVQLPAAVAAIGLTGELAIAE